MSWIHCDQERILVMDKVIDTELALEQAAGNEQLAKELFQMLLTELPELLGKLQSAVHANDSQAIWDHAHKIYGSTAYCGVPALRTVAQKLESDIKAQDTNAIQSQTRLLADEVQRLLASGKEYLQRSWS
jgi:two-component system sensor histidine kinase BarA